MQSKFWFLKRIKLFSNLKDEELKDLDKITRMEEVRRRQPVYLPGDTAHTVYLLKEGRVKISRVTEDGKEFTLAILEPGEVFGELEVLEGSPRDTVAEALEDISICVIQRKDFEEVLRKNPDLTIRLTKLIGFRLKKIENRIEDLVFRDVPTRLAHLLLSLSKEFGEENKDGVRLGVKMTHQELANLIGSTRETVSATLNDFKRQGLIRQDHHAITVRDKQRLSEIR
jgi:CRP/FNR family transcriptional regulator, cyclic AMP receptor protein